MSLSDLMDFETLVQVKRAAPQVTPVPFDIACWVVRALEGVSVSRSANVDQHGHLFWQASVKELAANITDSETVTFAQIGRALKAMGLESWRKADGYHVAWSIVQLTILKKYFKT